MEQGENPATFADSLVQRQSSCHPTSHRKPRQKHARSRSGDLEHSTKEDQRHLRAETKGLSSPTSAAHLYPQEKRPKTSFRHSDMGCTLPFFPGDVRDSMGYPPGGSELPIHCHNHTVPHLNQ